jgi:hypothetical protein
MEIFEVFTGECLRKKFDKEFCLVSQLLNNPTKKFKTIKCSLNVFQAEKSQKHRNQIQLFV